MPSNLYAVIGNPIEHSLSPLIHRTFGEQLQLSICYEKILGFPATFNQEVLHFLTKKGKGLNVTQPFKEMAFLLANNKTPRCLKASAANTLWLREGKICADNTDGIGFIRDISRYINLKKTRILILGAGGAARGLLASLTEIAVKKITVAVRNEYKVTTLLSDFPTVAALTFEKLPAEYDLIINATSATLRKEPLILPEILMKTAPFFYDLSYDLSKPSAFLQEAYKHNCSGCDGLGMLVEQAAESFYIWHGLRPNTELVLKNLSRLGPDPTST